MNKGDNMNRTEYMNELDENGIIIQYYMQFEIAYQLALIARRLGK